MINIKPKQTQKLLHTAFLFFLVIFFHNSTAQPVLTLDTVITGLSSPVDFVNAGDGSKRIFVVERSGNIQVFDSNLVLINNNFLTVSGISCCGERGLLSMAFHPDYETNRYFFVYYTNAAFGVEVARYQTLISDSNQADASTKTIIMTIQKMVDESNHNGGKLNFGPDGNLYFGVGDSGGSEDPRNMAQRPDSLWGKMVRVNVDNFTTPPFYSIPDDNPYSFSVDTLPHIWSFGLRNPWRWSFDRLTGDMWIADVGQDEWEEVNYTLAGTPGGLNYGWRCYEATHPLNTTGCQPQSAYIDPIFEYPHDATGGISVTGGYVYRGTEYPLLYGYYVCADYQTSGAASNGWLIRPDGFGGWDTTLQTGLPNHIVSFGETEDGALYAVKLDGLIFKVTATSLVPVTLVDFSVTAGSGYHELEWKTLTEQNVLHYEIELSNDGTRFRQAGVVQATNNGSYKFRRAVTATDKVFYRLKIVDNDGKFAYSKIISASDPVRQNANFVNPSVVRSGRLQLRLQESYDRIQIINMEGREVWRQNITGRSGNLNFYLPSLIPGTYEVRVLGKQAMRSQRIIIP